MKQAGHFYLVFQSSPDLQRLLRAVLCFSSSLFFSWLARSLRTASVGETQFAVMFTPCGHITTSSYRCHRCPWLVCLVLACSRSEEWCRPYLGATRSAAWQSMWSCTSANKWETHRHTWTLFHWGQAPLSSECMNQSHLCGVGWSGCDPPQQLTRRNHFNAVCSGRGTLLQGLHSRKTKISPPLISFSCYRGKTDVRKLAIDSLSAWNQSYLSDLFLLCHFLVFLMSFKSSGVYSIQALCPLPIQSTQLLFTAPHTQTHTQGFLPKSWRCQWC